MLSSDDYQMLRLWWIELHYMFEILADAKGRDLVQLLTHLHGDQEEAPEGWLFYEL